MFVLTNLGFSQNCKFKINEIDKFTKKVVKLTKSEKVIGSFFTSGEFSVKKSDTNYNLILDYSLSAYSNMGNYSIKKGAKLIFLLENGETIEFKCLDNIDGINNIIYGVPTVYNCQLLNVNYTVNSAQLVALSQIRIVSIRFYRTGGNGAEDFVDNEVKRRNQDDIMNLSRCIL
jgi:hypothetical protein